MAQVEIQSDSDMPAVCVKTGEPAHYTFTARVIPVRPGVGDPIGLLVPSAWPLALCLCWLGPALLLLPSGNRIQLPVSRRTLRTLDLLWYTAWFVLGGSLVAGILPALVVGWCAGGPYLAIAVIGCLAAYPSAVAYKLYAPAGKAHQDKTTGRLYTVLNHVHPTFATAVVDERLKHLAGAEPRATELMPADTRAKVGIVAVALAISLIVVALEAGLVYSIFGPPTPAC